ncbi:MAG: hypothetical protein A2Y60_01875 [Chloroflexi bacterium RBG_13_54_9]|nr:MAG: hypothetical protein A2Y60_01875 [Chloroflexi bacterium RBG_13_54_9]
MSYSPKRKSKLDSERLTYKVAEAAKLLDLSRNSVYQACLTGQIPSLRIGKRILIPRIQLDRMLNEAGKAKN